MRLVALLCCLAWVCACGPDPSGTRDAAVPDGRADAAPDMPADASLPDGIAEARGTAPGPVSLPIHYVVVTYLKPQVGNPTNDPAGFTVQAHAQGPALFVSVDPSLLTPAPAIGDVVSFTITMMGAVGMQPRAQAIAGYTRFSTGTNVNTFTQDVSMATDLVSNQVAYDSELVTLTGTAFEAFQVSGQSFLRAGFSTAGLAGNTNLQLRAPMTLVDSLDLALGCIVTVHDVPVSRFDAQTQINAYSASDLVIGSCPAPTVHSAVALSATTVRITFSRTIKPSSVLANGSQFTFDNGLTASGATVSGRTVTVTTSAQTPSATYAVTVAGSVLDQLSAGVTGPGTTFAGFVVRAVARINELNATIASGCDRIELRVIQSGSLAGFKLRERTGAAGELEFTFPPGFMVQKNDFVLVHTTGTPATCNPGGATQELATKTDQPAATFTNNVDTAFDFWATDNGLTSTDNVLTLFDPTGAIVDAVFVSDDAAASVTSTPTETAAAAVGMANQWQPAMATYLEAVFRMHAVDDLNATGTTPAGTSIQRVDNTDDNDQADWTTGVGAASSWGGLNSGQTALP